MTHRRLASTTSLIAADGTVVSIGISLRSVRYRERPRELAQEPRDLSSELAEIL